MGKSTRAIKNSLLILFGVIGYSSSVAQPLDCTGVPWGSAVPGTPCDDGNPFTISDHWRIGCYCLGQCWDPSLDCFCTDGTAYPGMACDDGDAITINEVWQESCDCMDGSNILSGLVFIDVDQDGVYGVNDHPVYWRYLTAGPSHYTTTRLGGIFNFRLSAGSYDLTVMPGPYDQQAAPYPTQDLVGSGMTSAGHEIAMIPSLLEADLTGVMTAPPPRPGYQNGLWMNVRNQGTIPSGGTVTLTFAPEQQFVLAFPAGTPIGNTITWNVPVLQVGEYKPFYVKLYTPPFVALGTPLTHTAIVQADLTDADPANDLLSLDQIVVGAFDPNDKLVTPSVMSPQEIAEGSYVTYTIRFQNTGTYMAESVQITDSLSSAFDIESFQFLGSSHDCEVSLNDHWLGFRFNEIMLPDSGSNEPESHGCVVFRIRLQPEMPIGTSIENSASIYFDYNDAVVTEPAVLTVDHTSSVGSEGTPLFYHVWPNPVSDLLFLKSNGELDDHSIELIDAQGRILKNISGMDDRSSISFSTIDLAEGVYFLKVCWGRCQVIKIIKTRTAP